jgi:ferric-dicitrate binding protein FerR (iron transport regulator)
MSWRHPSAEGAAIGALVRADAPGLDLRSGWLRRSAARAGDTLRGGQTYTVSGATLVALQEGGTLRAAPGSVFEIIDANSINLHSGQVYVDLPPSSPRAATFSVITSVGRVEHLGTQFEIATFTQNVRIRVREGKIRLLNSSGFVAASAGTELLASTSGTISRRSIGTHGRDWAWVEALAPEYSLDNQHLIDFLHWVGRETGRTVQIADARAQQLVDETMLRGSVRGLTPLEALSNVVATTSVRFQLLEDSIRVSSGE